MTGAVCTTAVVLVGGLGTRLRPLTHLRPKPIIPLGDIPLVGHQLLWLARHGIERVILAGGYKADMLSQRLAETDWGLEVSIVQEPEPLDTAGAIKYAAKGLEGTIVATNGDIVLDAPLCDMMQAHAAADACATILLRRVEDVSQYGLVLRDERGRVVEFREKQPEDPTGQRTVNAGVYLLNCDVLDSVPSGRPWSMERQLFPGLLARGGTVLGFLPAEDYYWIDVGRVETYRQAHRDILSGKLVWSRGGVLAGAEVASTARLRQPLLICPRARIGDGAAIGPYTSIGAETHVGAGAMVADSIVWEGARIGKGARVSGCIVATGATVPPGEDVADRIVMPE